MFGWISFCGEISPRLSPPLNTNIQGLKTLRILSLKHNISLLQTFQVRISVAAIFHTPKICICFSVFDLSDNESHTENNEIFDPTALFTFLCLFYRREYFWGKNAFQNILPLTPLICKLIMRYFGQRQREHECWEIWFRVGLNSLCLFQLHKMLSSSKSLCGGTLCLWCCAFFRANVSSRIWIFMIVNTLYGILSCTTWQREMLADDSLGAS